MNVCAFLHHPPVFSSRSGMDALAGAVGAERIYYDAAWQRLERRSWTAGYLLRRIGIAYYGSEWNWLVPLVDELKLANAMPSLEQGIAHFLWGEFASPSMPALFRRKAKVLIGTFHCSARRLPRVLRRPKRFGFYDRMTLMSESQRQFFEDAGFPPGRLHVILHGVDTKHFCPGEPVRGVRGDGPVAGLFLGETERDHAFMIEVLRKLPDGVLKLAVHTHEEHAKGYRGIPSAEVLPRVPDGELVARYREADLLVMPMLDCTANNAVLESMACGTPVMINRVGGVPEYVDASCNVVMEDKKVDEWVDVLVDLARNREKLSEKRRAVRKWAERFSWDLVAEQYLQLYQDALGT